MSDKTQIMDNIKEALEKIHKGPAAYRKKFFTYVFKKCKDISDTELYDIIGETLKIFKNGDIDIFLTLWK